MFLSLRRLLPVLLFAAPTLAIAAEPVPSELKTFTGRHTRVVWIQDAGPTACIYAEQPTVLLMGLDSDDGKGERKIVAEPNSFFKPLLTADGQRVVYTDHVKHNIYVVPFAGGTPKVLLKEAELEDTWTDPVSGVEWIYARVNINMNPGDVVMEDSWGAGQVRRFRSDNPNISELVWDKSQVGHFQVAGDGAAASGAGLNGQGLFILPNQSFTPGDNGCWPSIAPDDSHRFWVFNGHHNGVHLFTPLPAGGFDRWDVTMSIGAGEMLHPRWTNNVRYMVMTGPYASFDWRQGAKITNEVAAGVEVYVGRFSPNFRGIEQWCQVTHNQRGDYWPNVWIEPEPGAKVTVHPASPIAKDAAVKFDPTLQFLFKDVHAPNQTSQDDGNHLRLCGVTLGGTARFGRYGLIEPAGGFVQARDSEEILQACQSAGAFSLSFTLIPASHQAHDSAVVALFTDPAGKEDLKVIQKADHLLASVNTHAGKAGYVTIDLGKISSGAPGQSQHVTISFAEGHLKCWVDGRPIAGGETASGDLKGWTAKTILFGADAKSEHAWSGSLCDITVHSRALNDAEAMEQATGAAERAKLRTPATRVVVEAVLAGHTSAADPRAIAPYLRCLSLSTYTVTKVVEGKLDAKTIAVYQWSVLGGQRVQEYEKLKTGQSRRLVLEAFADHPEQDSERQTNTIDDTDELPLYYDVEFPMP